MPVMTAVGLLDVLARQCSTSGNLDADESRQLTRLAAELIESSLADLQRLKNYERQYVTHQVAGPEEELELRRLIWDLLRQWADDATHLLNGVKSLLHAGLTIEGLNALDDALGRVEARLTVTPQQIAAAIAQAREGQFIPAKELRDELHARLRT
jgi:hypothetical protein